MPDILSLVVALSAILFLGLTLPIAVVVAAWAALLPIWTLGEIPPSYFDGARYGLAFIIGVRAHLVFGGSKASRFGEYGSWVALLTVAGVWVLLSGLLRPDSIDSQTGLATVVSVLTAFLVTRRLSDVRPLLVGFVSGSLFSALVLISTAAGFPVDALVPNDQPGYGRLTGLSSSAPRVSTEMALAGAICVGLILDRRSSRRIVLGIGSAICIVAMLLSGGRVGLAMIVLAMLVLLVRGRTSLLALVPGSLVLFLVLWLTSTRGLTLNTIDRFQGSSGSDLDSISTGRWALNLAAVEEVQRNPLLGTGTVRFVEVYGTTAHFAPLLFGVAGGILPLIILGFLTLRLAVLAFRFHDRQDSVSVGITASMLVLTLVEPNGPFVGLGTVVILLSVLRRGPVEVRASDSRGNIAA